MLNEVNCPICGQELKSTTIKKGKHYTRSFKSFICRDCNYAEYDNNERESMVESGKLDGEFNILNTEEL